MGDFVGLRWGNNLQPIDDDEKKWDSKCDEAHALIGMLISIDLRFYLSCIYEHVVTWKLCLVKK